jgi:hypothetical protein
MMSSAMTPAIPAPMAKVARSRNSAIPDATTMLDTKREHEHRQPVAEALDEDRPEHRQSRQESGNASPARMARAMSPRRAGRIAFAVKPIIR